MLWLLLLMMMMLTLRRRRRRRATTVAPGQRDAGLEKLTAGCTRTRADAAAVAGGEVEEPGCSVGQALPGLAVLGVALAAAVQGFFAGGRWWQAVLE